MTRINREMVPKFFGEGMGKQLVRNSEALTTIHYHSEALTTINTPCTKDINAAQCCAAGIAAMSC